GDAEIGVALRDEGKLGAGAEADIDGVRGQALLQLGAAGEIDLLDVETVLFEEALLHTDIERREIEWQSDGFTDAQRRIGRGCVDAENGHQTGRPADDGGECTPAQSRDHGAPSLRGPSGRRI